MFGKILPLVLAFAGLGIGSGAGLFMRPASDAEDHDASANAHGIADDHSKGGHTETAEADAGAPEYVKMNNQFVVPVVHDGHVVSLVVLSLTLEVDVGATEYVYQREPKLRDAFLQVLFDHANVGGFSGSFTDGSNLVVLRTSLKEAAALVIGAVVSDVLITDIARQDG